RLARFGITIYDIIAWIEEGDWSIYAHDTQTQNWIYAGPLSSIALTPRAVQSAYWIWVATSKSDFYRLIAAGIMPKSEVDKRIDRRRWVVHLRNVKA
ncbi:MAG: hypothetical protein ACRDJE_00875, partial [Dehalococcoidia bacterium]